MRNRPTDGWTEQPSERVSDNKKHFILIVFSSFSCRHGTQIYQVVTAATTPELDVEKKFSIKCVANVDFCVQDNVSFQINLATFMLTLLKQVGKSFSKLILYRKSQ